MLKSAVLVQKEHLITQIKFELVEKECGDDALIQLKLLQVPKERWRTRTNSLSSWPKNRTSFWHLRYSPKYLRIVISMQLKSCAKRELDSRMRGLDARIQLQLEPHDVFIFLKSHWD